MEINQVLAGKYFADGFNCAQSVIAVFSEKYGLDKDIALKISGGMGGGFRSGDICGAASGAVLVIGLKYGPHAADDIEAKKICRLKTIEFLKAFKSENKCLACRDLIKCDTSTEEGEKYFKDNNLSKKICTNLVVSSVKILDELGY